MKAILLLSFSYFIEFINGNNLAFVFELNRHGARAPILEDTPGYFEVAPGDLTPSGMRQRYLLGRRNREKYIYKTRFLDETYNPLQIEIQSTDVSRTL